VSAHASPLCGGGPTKGLIIMIYVALIIGIIIGAYLGLLVAALAVASKDDNEYAQAVRYLEQHDTRNPPSPPC